MKTIFLTSVALGIFAGAAAFADTTTRMIERIDTIRPAEAQMLLPDGYEIGAFQCPTIASDAGNWRVTPAIAKDMRRMVQEAHRGTTVLTEEVEVPIEPGPLSVSIDHPGEVDVPTETVTVISEIIPSDVRGVDSFGIGDVLFTFNAMAGQCDLWTFRDWNG